MNHTMQLKETYMDGSERWKCPVCDREFIVTWQPYKKDVLNEGNQNAVHSGGKGGISMGSVSVEKVSNLDNIWLDAFDSLF